MTFTLIFLLYADYRKWYILELAAAVLVSQCKETGVVVIMGYYGLRIVADFIVGKGGILSRFKTVMHKKSIWIALATGTIYEVLIWNVGNFVTWKPNGNAQTGLWWSNTGSNCFGFNKTYILRKFRQLFGANFAWIVSIIIVCAIAITLFKRLTKRKTDKGKTNVLIYGGLFGALFGFALFSFFYITACLNRYNILFAVGWSIIGIIAYYYMIGYKHYRLVNFFTVVVLGGLFFIQSFWNIDAVSSFLFNTIPIDNKNTILFTDLSYYGDGLVNNYQYTWLDQALNKFLSKIKYDSDKVIYLPVEEISGTQINGTTGVYKVSWNPNKQKRVISKENMEEVAIQVYWEPQITGSIPYNNLQDALTEDVPSNMYIPIIKYYNVDEDRLCRSLETLYYFGEKDVVKSYGGEIEYYQAIRKDNYDGFNLSDVWNRDDEILKLGMEDINEQYVKEIWESISVNKEMLNAQIYEECEKTIESFKSDRKIVQKGDVVATDICAYDKEGNRLKEEIVNFSLDGYQVLEIGSGQCLPGIEEALIGAELGDTVSVECKIPSEYAPASKFEGQIIVFEITPLEIQSVITLNENSETIDEKAKKVEENLKRNELENVINEISFRFDFESLNCSMESLKNEIENIKDYYKGYMIQHDITKEQFLGDFLRIDEERYEQMIEKVAELTLAKTYITECFDKVLEDIPS